MSTLQYLHLASIVPSDGKSGGISKCSLQGVLKIKFNSQ
jgi:hypothetical protein